MPLSKPAAPRKHLHLRNVECRGYLREDGLWEIEGRIVDTKTYSFHNSYRGMVEAGEPVHDMWLRLTLDDSMRILEVEAVTDHGPFRTCPAITANFKRLEGLTIGPGFRRAVRERVGGLQGCTHLVELVGPVATTAFQTMTARREDHGTQEAKAGTDAGPSAPKRPPFLDTCHALASDGPVVKEQWPEFYTGKG